jgi:hypothetical protein
MVEKKPGTLPLSRRPSLAHLHVENFDADTPSSPRRKTTHWGLELLAGRMLVAVR